MGTGASGILPAAGSGGREESVSRDDDGPEAAQLSPAVEVRFREYRLQNVYLRTTRRQRAEIMDFWQQEEALEDRREAERRSQEAVFLVRAASGELAGLSTVGLIRIRDGRVYYAYRMFLRRRDRVPYLMLAVVTTTRDFLRTFPHPTLQPSGMLHVNENPKLMRPGVRRLFERFGYRCWGTTREGEEVWGFEFGDQTRGVAPASQWREGLTKLIPFWTRRRRRNLEFQVI